jgi:hypothetical protein
LLASCNGKSNNPTSPTSPTNSTGPNLNGEWIGNGTNYGNSIKADIHLVQSGDNITGLGSFSKGTQIIGEITGMVGTYIYPEVSLLMMEVSSSMAPEGEASFQCTLSGSDTLNGTMVLPGYSEEFSAVLIKK